MKRLSIAAVFLCLLVACGGGQDGQPDELSVSLTADQLSVNEMLPVNFTASVPDADTSVVYFWDFGTGETAQGSSSRAYTFEEAGSYEVTVEVSKDGKEASDSVIIEVEEAPVEPGNRDPVVELTASTVSGKAPLPVEFTANAIDPDGDELSYSWNFGDSATVAANSSPEQSHTFETEGSYEATVTVTDDRGGVAQASLQVAVADPDSGTGEPPTIPVDPDDNEPPVVTLSASTQRGTAPLTVSFGAEASDPDNNPVTYSWNFGNGDTAEGNSSYTVTYAEPGSYTATVEASDGLATAQASVTIEVVEPGTTPGDNTPPSVAISAKPTSGKAPLPVAFSSEVSDPDSDALSYVWDFGDGTISGQEAPTHTYSEAGEYTASLTVGDRDGGMTRKELQISVEAGSGGPDVPFYGEWAWAAKSEKGKIFEGYLSISERLPDPTPPNVIEGGQGSLTHCKDGVDACGAPNGVGHIDTVDYGSGEQYDIVFIDNATGMTQLVAFDDDDTVGSEINGAPTLMGGGSWFYPNGSSEGLNFAMVKISNNPSLAMTSALRALRAEQYSSR